MDLVQMAAHEPRIRHGERLERGELLVAIRYLADDRWKWSKGRTERFISDLKARSQIETRRETPNGTVYRIVNYGTYAVLWDIRRDADRDADRDRSGTGVGQQVTIEPLNHLEPLERERATTEEFNDLMAQYGRGNLIPCWSAYAKVVPAEVSHEDLMRARAEYCARQGDDPQYWQSLDRWILEKGWASPSPKPKRSSLLDVPLDSEVEA